MKYSENKNPIKQKAHRIFFKGNKREKKAGQRLPESNRIILQE
jgi:hypothetical protein